jgi:transposase InsO family protein
LAIIIDCYTKAVVGWAIDNYKTPLIEKAIAMVAGNHRLADDAIFHSDRGIRSAEPGICMTTRWPKRSCSVEE